MQYIFMFSVSSTGNVNTMENMTVFSQRFNYLIIYARKLMGRDSSVNEMIGVDDRL
jgi:hypothetical protein